MQDDETVAVWAEQIRSASHEGRALRFRGGGTKDWYGETLEGEILDTRAHHGILAYDPAELVITARAGTLLAEIEATLAGHGQMLAFEPPHFGTQATLGGCIAAGLAGPRRQASGAPRDFVLGAAVMNGHGQTLHFGGQVVKNVAGYDVSRLLAGSLGTLGLIVSLSLKVLPQAKAETTLKFDMNGTDAVRKLNEWGGRPLPISASAWRDGTLALRLSGAEAAVKAARTTLGGEVVDAVEAARFWISLREQTDPFFYAYRAQCGAMASGLALRYRAAAIAWRAVNGMGWQPALVDHRYRCPDRAHERETSRWPRHAVSLRPPLRPGGWRIYPAFSTADEDSSRPEKRFRPGAYF